MLSLVFGHHVPHNYHVAVAQKQVQIPLVSFKFVWFDFNIILFSTQNSLYLSVQFVSYLNHQIGNLLADCNIILGNIFSVLFSAWLKLRRNIFLIIDIKIAVTVVILDWSLGCSYSKHLLKK